MVAARATVCQRTARSPTRCRRGSKSNAMTAIGTVPAVYRAPACRLADTLSCHAFRGRRVPGATRCGRPAGCAGVRPRPTGGEGRVWGPSDRDPGVRPPGGRAGRRDLKPRGMDVTMRIPQATVPEVDLLGRFASARPGREIRLVGRHAQALFTLLALTRRPRTREAIAADLWPDSMVSATGPLRQALYQVRGALASVGVDPDCILESDTETLGMRATRSPASTPRSSRPAPTIPAARRNELSSSIPATSPRASATSASRPSASASPIATRTRWRSWRRNG